MLLLKINRNLNCIELGNQNGEHSCSVTVAEPNKEEERLLSWQRLSQWKATDSVYYSALNFLFLFISFPSLAVWGVLCSSLSLQNLNCSFLLIPNKSIFAGERASSVFVSGQHFGGLYKAQRRRPAAPGLVSKQVWYPQSNQLLFVVFPAQESEGIAFSWIWAYTFFALFSSATQSCLTLCNPMDCSTPGLPVRHQLLEFTQTHVHWVGEAIQPSHPLSSPSPPAFNLFQHQCLFKWVSSSHQVAKVLEF